MGRILHEFGESKSKELWRFLLHFYDETDIFVDLNFLQMNGAVFSQHMAPYTYSKRILSLLKKANAFW